VFDSADNPHISYYQTDTGTIRYAVRNSDGWTIENVGTLSDVQISFTGARRITAIDLDSSETPHIVFGDRGVIRYATPTGTGWEVSDILTAGDTPFGQLVTFRLEGTASASTDAVIVYVTRP